ncbi:hypothetical protein SAMN02799630_01635 [Paenibacillus sp. UNCCL117]|uniref:hypothetical protein n=1 Tax=unclassified Paenibacillus TaxID=185978 RepID=UPI000890AE70|nr:MULTISPECIES: hypothetical protein [unclassified Paenibacillus]SDC89238.1 hypothetical protein SAMN04488602_104120 [Paenibacillus sp. cl123]SFW28504.1 hypothetical protein SAMN02799630_01635 [Paenibacillus sp. UNCCL117]
MKNGRKAVIVLLPGLATAPGFMDAIGAEMAERLCGQGWQTETAAAFPYGDWSRYLLAQLGEIAYDIALPPGQYERSIGAKRIRERLREAVQVSGEAGVTDKDDSAGPVDVLLLCHSGGGAAGLHAARWLRQSRIQSRGQGLVRVRCVLIGSPRCRVLPDEREDVLVIGAAGHPGLRWGDPVTLLGRWGGWERTSLTRLRWNRSKHAPAVRITLPLVGGHPDYFRSYAPYMDEQGITNLQKTADSIERWLAGQWGEKPGG